MLHFAHHFRRAGKFAKAAGSSTGTTDERGLGPQGQTHFLTQGLLEAEENQRSLESLEVKQSNTKIGRNLTCDFAG